MLKAFRLKVNASLSKNINILAWPFNMKMPALSAHIYLSAKRPKPDESNEAISLAVDAIYSGSILVRSVCRICHSPGSEDPELDS